MEGIRVSQIAAGGWHSLALSEDGKVWGKGEMHVVIVQSIYSQQPACGPRTYLS